MLSRQKENQTERIISSVDKPEDKALDLSLRPKKLGDFIGQSKIKQNLEIFLQAAQKRNEPIEHTLLYGPPGLGKTTLAFIIAREMSANIKVTSGPAIEKAGDLASLLTNMEEGDVLFIDEVHRMNKIVEEVLYPAMEDFVLDIMVGQGPSAKSIRLDLPRFTIIGATTRIGLLSSPLRDRFGATYRLNFYQEDEIEKIVARSAKILGIEVADKAVSKIASRARKTPRVANRLLKRVRDFAQVKAAGKIDEKVAKDALKMLDVDNLGLDYTDRQMLEAIIDKFDGGPVGLKTLAAAISEEVDTIEDVYEPFLLQAGLIARTPKGRVTTKTAYKHLGREYNKQEPLI